MTTGQGPDRQVFHALCQTPLLHFKLNTSTYNMANHEPPRNTTDTSHAFYSFKLLAELFGKLCPDVDRAARKTIRGFNEILHFKNELQLQLYVFKTGISCLTGVDDLEEISDWTSAEEIIRKRCESYWGMFLDCMDTISTSLARITAYLGLVDGPESPDAQYWQNLSRQVIPRLTGPLKTDVEICLTDIKETNQRLNKIDDSKKKNGSPSKAQWTQLGNIRGHNRDAINVLGDENGFQCHHGGGIPTRHRAYLRIKGGFDGMGSNNPLEPQKLCPLVFHNGFVPSNRSSTQKETKPLPNWRWCEVRADFVGDETASLEKTRTSDTSKTDETSKSSLRSSKQDKNTKAAGKERKKLRFSLPKPSSSTLKKWLPRLGPNENVVRGAPSSSLTTTSDLCAFLDDAREPGALGAHPLLSRTIDGTAMQLHIHHTDGPGDTATWSDLLTLPMIWDGLSQSSIPAEVKLEWALKVTYGTFYAVSTPWLDNCAERRGMSFVVAEGGRHTGEVLLSRSFDAPGNVAESPETSEQQVTKPPVHFSVKELGRLLVEICWGAKWEAIEAAFLSTAEKAMTPSIDMEAVVMGRILRWARYKGMAPQDSPFHPFGNSYIDAIDGCVILGYGAQFPKPNPFDDETYAREVYAKVLRPLHNAREMFDFRQQRIFGSIAEPTKQDGSHWLDNNQPVQGLLCDDGVEVSEEK